VKALLMVAAGGAFGSGLRYVMSVWTMQLVPGWRFPLGTFSVNIIGCLAAGLLAGLVARQEFLSADLRLLLFVGVLGGFTTFSAFGLETIALLRRGDTLVAGGYVAASLVVGLAAVAVGFLLTHRAA
jgi:fluoride exporter